MTQKVFFFGDGRAEGTREWKDLLGGKGANLAEMTNIGIPVPPGFTISCPMCDAYLKDGKVPEGLREEVEGAITRLETASGRRFGDPANPLLVSVRSGARVSMPGMMETILNLGLNDETVAGLATLSGNPRFAWDSYRRFLQMYGDVVLNAPSHHFEALLAAKRMVAGVETDAEVPVELLQALIVEYKALVRSHVGHTFPLDPREQLWGAIEAVWRSWMIKRAVDYRRQYNIAESPGTAVNIVSMVFGNLGDDSGTGVAFTRDPSTGAKRFYGEFLINAQGEDVVAGIRTPLPIDRMAGLMPGPHAELMRVQDTLEQHFRDMQDLEFTVERGKLYLLQTRTGKRTVGAAVRIARDMVAEGLITQREAVQRVQPMQLDQLLHPIIDSAGHSPLATGLPASPGAASGVAVFDADVAEAHSKKGEKVILVRDETTPDDFHGILAARAVLTARGGMTSHAAVVARGMGKCAVVGCTAIKVDGNHRTFTVGETVVKEGDWVTLDGATGHVYVGDIPTQPSEVMRVMLGEQPPDDAPVYQAYNEILNWADGARRLKVRANADTPHDARQARRFGAEGIGLCRTEHMFFEGDRITSMREMICAHDEAGRRRALAKLLPMQRADFEGIFEAMDGLPVTIRLLDPPLHEFLPHGGGEEAKILARTLGVTRQELTHVIESLRETNPMLGHRGCRLGITYPEITEMQARAIFEAAAHVIQRGVKVLPEVMVPLVATHREFTNQRAIIDRVAAEVAKETGIEVPFLAGTMIELPRAALTAGEIADAGAQFFSFGTNDLTQTTLGLSRDDAGRFVPFYVERGVFPDDPFQVLDVNGVGKLITMAVRDGRAAREGLKVGICGEHGGEPRSIQFCHAQGLDYVSCSPFRVPIARLAAAHAALD
ncbi:MAG: pyruvate, phosphate dikinase [Gemmatimonadaceae bacterium]|nr:pyruvate, phosphate dikinase [Gemmatimonadaceae bacterium]